jgi:hypothetical protein
MPACSHRAYLSQSYNRGHQAHTWHDLLTASSTRKYATRITTCINAHQSLLRRRSTDHATIFEASIRVLGLIEYTSDVFHCRNTKNILSVSSGACDCGKQIHLVGLLTDPSHPMISATSTGLDIVRVKVTFLITRVYDCVRPVSIFRSKCSITDNP